MEGSTEEAGGGKTKSMSGTTLWLEIEAPARVGGLDLVEST